MATRKDYLTAILKALLAGAETSALVKIPATFIAELASLDKAKLKELNEASEQFDELLTQAELSTYNAAKAAVGCEQIKKLVSTLANLTNKKLEALAKLTEQEFKNIAGKLDRIDNTTTEINQIVKSSDGKLDQILSKFKTREQILACLRNINDGSIEANEAIVNYATDEDFTAATKYIRNKIPFLQSEDESDENIISKEQELREIIKAGIFYEGTNKLDELIAKDLPNSADLGELVQIINSDNDLAIYFYRENTNPGWLGILDNAGQFKQLEDADIANDFLARMKAFYLVEVSEERPKEVVDLISELDVKDWCSM